MALPVNISEILKGRTVEWDRIEYKSGWNPGEVIKTICAFANDLNNWGGGYIFIGIEEKDGIPQLPAKGISKSSLDKIQKELVNISHQIEPYYLPVYQPYEYEGKNIFVIWVPGGDNRPYKAPDKLGEKGQKRYFIRRGSVTTKANNTEEKLLFDMAKKIPFDDRVNHHASVNDLSFALIRDYLEEVKSDLRDEAIHMSLTDLAVQMRIASGPKESLLPLNAGLLFFSEQPEKFFRGAITEVVTYTDEKGKQFTEKIFSGPIHRQLKNVISYIETNFIKEKVTKLPDRPEALRVFNYPMQAIEETVANAFYHRSYELDNPIEINIWPDKIEILSFPGPLPPVTKEMLKERRIISRNYRNRRVGDFLKELDLTEGRSTGFPNIYDAMNDNGSPKPIFETDEYFNYFLAVLPINETCKQKIVEQTKKPNISLTPRMIRILQFCITPRKRKEIFDNLNISNHPKNYSNNIKPLLENGLLVNTLPDKKTSPKQKYLTTDKGKLFLDQLIHSKSVQDSV